MLGGQQPPDRELDQVLDAAGLGDNLYPGAANADPAASGSKSIWPRCSTSKPASR